MSESGELLTVEQAAERLKTSPHFVRRLVQERRIAFCRVGRYIRLAAEDLDAFVEAGRVEPITVRWRNGRVVA